MEQGKSKSFLQIVLERTNWKDIYEEHYGVNYVNEEVEPVETEQNNLKYKGRNFPVEVEGQYYENTKVASQKLNINYHTLRDWISRKRKPKIQCKKLPSCGF